MTTTTNTIESQALACLKFLADCDSDHASEENGIGFSKRDVEFGHALAACTFLTPRQLWRASIMLQIYRKQLERAGFTVPPVLPEPAAGAPRPIVRREPQPPQIKLIDGLAHMVFDGYPGEIAVGKVKAIKNQTKSKGYDANTKHWVFTLNAVPALVAAFPDLVVPDQLRYSAEREAAVIKQRADDEIAASLARADRADVLVADFEAKNFPLFDYQREDVRTAVQSKYHGYGLFYRRGAGKTIPALLCAKTWGVKIIVLTTNSAMENWKREAARAGVEIDVYNWASQPSPDLYQEPFILIADESHKSQTWAEQDRDKKSKKLLFNDDGSPKVKGSQRTWDFLMLAKSPQCKALYPLTGTPFPNGRARELFATLYALGHWVAENRWSYDKTYAGAYKDRYGYHNDGLTNADKLRDAIKDVCVFRGKARGKRLTRQPIIVEPTPERAKEHDRVLKELQKKYQERIDAGIIQEGAEALVETGQLRHAASVAKIDSAVAWAREYIAGGEKVLLYTQFLDVAATIATELDHDFISPFDGEVVHCRCDRITGSIAGNKRQAIVDKLTNGEVQVLVNVFGAAQEALNIQAASEIGLVDRTWVPGDADQAEGRIDRAGQTRDVGSWWFQYGPIDERIDGVNLDKMEAIVKVTMGQRKTMRGFKNASPGEMAKLVLENIFEAE